MPLLRMAAPQDVFAHLHPARSIDDSAASRAQALKHWMVGKP
jgi:hypothetical protein